MGPVQLITVTQDNACNFTRIIIIIIFKTEAASNYTEHITAVIFLLSAVVTLANTVVGDQCTTKMFVVVCQ